MKVSELDFSYPESLVGLSPRVHSRVLWVEPGNDPMEVTWRQFLNSFSAEDLIILNDTRVVPCRVFAPSGLDVAFLSQVGSTSWQVLTSLKKWPKTGSLELPGGVMARITEGGRPQTIEVSQELTAEYFDKYGELAIPPYILKARGEQHMRPEDLTGYQTCFAEKRGSLAAPTASLHFKPEDLSHIKSRGVDVVTLTLHVGLGTFLPVDGEDLSQHKMHSEWVEVSPAVVTAIGKCRERGGKVWALGTTVTRALETWALKGLPDEGFQGFTDLMIQPGFKFQVVDVLMTNFHQPKSTLLALVMAFAGVDRVKQSYAWAIQREFQLFSYGDLSVWLSQKS
jgi:S-adenosylmethionine:tRNA ribosyltransferase-isomerase